MRLLGVLAAGTFVLAAACGGGSDGPGPGPTPQQTLDRINPSVTTLSLGAGATSTISVTALDTQGATISSPGQYSFQSANGAIAEATNSGTVLGISSGSTSINISLTRGGITKTATVQVTVTGTLPATANVAAGSANVFDPQIVAIARNGSVTWTFGSVLHNVTFSAANSPARIPDTANSTASRTFTTAGDFPYDCGLHAGMTGRVFVR